MRHQRKREDRLFSLMERVLAIQEQTLAAQNRLLEIWSGGPDASPSNATAFRTVEEDFLLENLKKAAEYEDDDAKAILEDPMRLEAYLAQFRD